MVKWLNKSGQIIIHLLFLIIYVFVSESISLILVHEVHVDASVCHQ